MSQIGIIIGREFNERVRKKSFIITTILVPLLFLGIMTIPALLLATSKIETKEIAVIDRSGVIAPALRSGEEVIFETTEQQLDEARKDTERFGVLWIGEDVVTNPDNVRLYANSSSSIMLEEIIERQIAEAIEAERLRAYHIDNLPEIMEAVKTSVHLQTFRNDEGDGQSRSAGVSYAIGYILGFVLYMFVLLYGTMVMQSVIEEKNSRVLDVMVSSVRPFDLMMGKILGIASVAVVQIVLWGVLLFGITAFALPALMPADAMTQAAAMQAGTFDSSTASNFDPDMVKAVAAATDFSYIGTIFAFLMLFLVGGYLLYSALFAAVGASVDNVQDAQQFATPVTLPIILALVIMVAIMQDPNSSISFWFSMIPFTSPIVMMARIPAGIPLWEPILSLALLYVTFGITVWFASKIYRVGIFMHGKKPSFKELWKWMRYKY